MSNQDHAHALPSGFMLEEYQIERVLGAGGFGITYYARDTHLNKAVAIKEYMPSDCAARYDEATVAPRSSSDAGNYDWGLTRFLEEARVLAGFDHPNINRVHRRLEAHGTAYIVLEYLSGKSLSERLKRTGRLSPDEVWRLFNELLSGLSEVHRQDYVHRDIKPGNIMFREDGGAVLLDFGAARQAIGQRTRSITTILTPFYAPPEQYDLKGHDVGPWSDFYALGVVAYRCVTGVGEGELLDAPRRERLAARGKGEEDLRPAVELARGEYDRRLLEAIDWCMRVDERERPRGVADLEEALKIEPPGPRPPREAKTSNQEHAYALPAGFMLEEYRIERLLGSGSVGITYYAWDTRLDKAVAIKEYLPSDCAARYDETTVAPKSSPDADDYDWGLARFLEEARVLAGFDYPHINKVYRQLEAHGTAYTVLEYLPGENLSDRLRRTGRLSPDEAWRFFNEMLSGLAQARRLKYVYWGITPRNIMFREDGSAVLLDFGAANRALEQRFRLRHSGPPFLPTTIPLEHYDQKAADVGPWSDFYALGVVAYRCVTGVGERELLHAVARARLAARGKGEEDIRPAVEAAKGEYDRRLLEAIDWCMRMDVRERPREVAALQKMLSGSGASKKEEKPEPAPDTEPVPPESNRSLTPHQKVFLLTFFVSIFALLFISAL